MSPDDSYPFAGAEKPAANVVDGVVDAAPSDEFSASGSREQVVVASDETMAKASDAETVVGAASAVGVTISSCVEVTGATEGTAPSITTAAVSEAASDDASGSNDSSNDSGNDSKEEVPIDPVVKAQRDRRLAIGLFALTVCTTAFSGLLLSRGYADLEAARSLLGFDFQGALPAWYERSGIIRESLSFPLALLCILGSHEFGHYLQAKRNDVEVSPPFFLPSVPPLGTLGAVIRMHVGEGTSSSSLMRVAAWGPIGGMIPALGVLILGIYWSELRPLPFDTDTLLYLRGGVLMKGIERLLLGPIPVGFDVFLHPVAFAGWAGCFVTALNMLPIGQLDGGHVIYALSPRHAQRVAKGAFYVLLIAGVFYTGWWVFALLVRFAIGVVHPEMTTDGGASGQVRMLGYVAIVLFLLTFHPAPITNSGLMDIWEGVQRALPYAPLWIRG